MLSNGQIFGTTSPRVQSDFRHIEIFYTGIRLVGRGIEQEEEDYGGTGDDYRKPEICKGSVGEAEEAGVEGGKLFRADGAYGM
jgi:hypothetical protein